MRKMWEYIIFFLAQKKVTDSIIKHLLVGGGGT